jgi:hypothetical protein
MSLSHVNVHRPELNAARNSDVRNNPTLKEHMNMHRPEVNTHIIASAAKQYVLSMKNYKLS